jgi:hypothetical protein
MSNQPKSGVGLHGKRCQGCHSQFAPETLNPAGHCKICALQLRVHELEVMLVECEEALLRSYNAQDNPTDGTSVQEIAARKAREVLLKGKPPTLLDIAANPAP